jgi:hypothetical protein
MNLKSFGTGPSPFVSSHIVRASYLTYRLTDTGPGAIELSHLAEVDLSELEGSSDCLVRTGGKHSGKDGLRVSDDT